MITSSNNSLLKQIRKLRRSKREREREGLFIIEGIQGTVEAVERGAPIDALVWAPEYLTSELALEAIEQAQAAGVRCEPVSAELFDSISDRDNPIGILALVARRFLPLEQVVVHPNSLFVALVEISDPGNLGTVLRTIDAAGGDALFLVGNTVDPFHPTTAKASAGTIFTVPMVQVDDTATLLRWLARQEVALVATYDQGARGYWELHYPAPLLLLMGSEAHGLPSELLHRAPQVARIPMLGHVDSLNLGVATALLLYEVRRQQWARGNGQD